MNKLFFILPVISGMFWGSSGIFVRTLTKAGMNSFTILTCRMAVAVVILFLIILFFDRSLLKIHLKDIWLFAAGGLLGTLGLNLCYNEAVNRLTLSLAAVLLSLAPVFVLLFAAIFFKEKITGKKVGCMLLAIFGCALVSGIFENASGLTWSASGIIIGASSAFFYALYSIFSKLAMERGYHPLTVTFYCLLLITAVLLPLTDWSAVAGFVTQSFAKHTGFLLLHSLCAYIMPYILYTVSLSHIEAGKASILASGEPVAAMIFGLIFYSEIPTVLSVCGLALTIAALTLLSMPDKKRLPKPKKTEKI